MRSCGEDPDEILSEVLGLNDLVQVLREDLAKILLTSSKKSLHDLVQVLVRRSCGDPAEILLKMSLQQHLES